MRVRDMATVEEQVDAVNFFLYLYVSMEDGDVTMYEAQEDVAYQGYEWEDFEIFMEGGGRPAF